jgi:prophage antirepressor-like protein
MNISPAPAGILPVVQHFNFEGYPVNMIDVGGEPWVLLKDFWALLGHPNAHIEELMAMMRMPYCRIAVLLVKTAVRYGQKHTRSCH